MTSQFRDQDHDWGRVFRLLFISTVATVASIGNIFTISAIIVDDLLRKKGNTFLVSVTLADLLITAIVLPASSVAILANVETSVENSESLCRVQYVIGTMSCLTAAVFTAATGIENFLRLKALRNVEYNRQHHIHPPTTGGLHAHMLVPAKQSICTVFQVTIMNLIMWLFSGIVVLIHFIAMPHLMYTICGSRRNDKLLLESVMILGVCFLVSVSVGGLAFLKCVCIMRSWDKPKPYLTSREFALVTSNCWNWLARFLIWFPSIVVAIVTQSQRLSSEPMTTSSPTMLSMTSAASTTPSLLTIDKDQIAFQRLLVWPAILPSCLGSLINAMANRDFRRCYVQLFHYCCCKTSVALTRRPRDNLRGGSDVRVHIIPGYNIYSSQAGHFSEVQSTPPRFNTFKCGPLMSCKRDVYEL